MFTILFRVFEHIFAGTCLALLSLVLLSSTTLIRAFPRILVFIRSVMRGLLLLSFRLYHMILTRLDRFIKPRFRIDLLSGPIRVFACILISLVFGTLFLLLTRLGISGWGIAIVVLHGLIVGLAWDGIKEPGGFQMGTKIQ